MEFSVYNPGEIDEIRNLFTRTFTDSENEAEGTMVGNLAVTIQHPSYKSVFSNPKMSLKGA